MSTALLRGFEAIRTKLTFSLRGHLYELRCHEYNSYNITFLSCLPAPCVRNRIEIFLFYASLKKCELLLSGKQ